MQFQSNDDYDGDMAEINIIPLVDVMLVLLIIFMVAAPLSIGGIKIELPFSKAKSTTISENRVVLTINSKGQYFLDKLEIPAVQLRTRLHSLFNGRKNKELFIRADKRVVYGKVVDAMSAAKIAGVGKMSMLTQATKTKRRR